MSEKLWLKSDANTRPYPEGIAWDEAWRQRRRADRLEAVLKDVSQDVFLYENNRRKELIRRTLENQYDY